MEETGQPSEGFTPLQAALLLFILTAAATLYGIRRKKTLWGIDLVLFFAAGMAGCILTFLVLFSQHPAVSPNYLLFVFHPLHLLCLPCMLNRVRKRRRSRNTFYIALAHNTAKISVSCITFGTLFADTFCEQPNSHIR